MGRLRPKKRQSARAKRRAEIGKPLIRHGNDPIPARDRDNGAAEPLRGRNGASHLFFLRRPRDRPLWDYVLAIHLLRLRREESSAGAGAPSALRPLPGDRGHQDLHLHRVPRHRLCALDPRTSPGLPGVPGQRGRRRLGPGLHDLPGARLGAPGERLDNQTAYPAPGFQGQFHRQFKEQRR